MALVVKKVVIDLRAEIVPARTANDVEILIQFDLVCRVNAETDGTSVRISSQRFRRRQLMTIRVVNRRIGSGAVPADKIKSLTRNFYTCGGRMPEPEGVELGDQIGLSVEN